MKLFLKTTVLAAIVSSSAVDARVGRSLQELEDTMSPSEVSTVDGTAHGTAHGSTMVPSMDGSGINSIDPDAPLQDVCQKEMVDSTACEAKCAVASCCFTNESCAEEINCLEWTSCKWLYSVV